MMNSGSDDTTVPEFEEKPAAEPSVVPPRQGDAVAPRNGVSENNDPDVLREKWLRAAADLDNFRKRANGLIESAVVNERRAILGAFLDVLDSLDHALAAHAGEENEWMQGFEAIRRQNLDILKRFGAFPIECLGETFDPHRHEAVVCITDPQRPDGTILEVLRAGYAFQDGAILRAPRVVVSRSAES